MYINYFFQEHFVKIIFGRDPAVLSIHTCDISDGELDILRRGWREPTSDAGPHELAIRFFSILQPFLSSH